MYGLDLPPAGVRSVPARAAVLSQLGDSKDAIVVAWPWAIFKCSCRAFVAWVLRCLEGPQLDACHMQAQAFPEDPACPRPRRTGHQSWSICCNNSEFCSVGIEHGTHGLCYQIPTPSGSSLGPDLVQDLNPDPSKTKN